MKNVIRTALYVRSNNGQQAIDDKVNRLIHSCSQQGKAVTHVYADCGFSGNQMDRPFLKQALEDAGNHLFDELLVVELSQLSRKADTLLSILKRLRAANITLHILGKQTEPAIQCGGFTLDVFIAHLDYDRQLQLANGEMA